MAESQAPSVQVVGMVGGSWFGVAATEALRNADLIVGAARLQRVLPTEFDAERLELFGPLDDVIDVIEAERAGGRSVTMLASGDPGFFGIERLLVGRFGEAVDVHPAPSSIALAFARARIHWDDAAVVSCHGRSLDRALPHMLAAPKVAVLVSKSTPPERIGQALVEAGSTHQHAVVVSKIGEPDEAVIQTDLAGLAAGSFDPLSVLILTSEAQPVATNAIVAWGRPVGEYLHRDSMITKPEVRAVVLSKLDLHPSATLWDVGAASGSVGIEAARLARGLRAFAIERNPEDCARIRANATRLPVSVVEGSAPDVFDELPAPDRVFVGGGGLDVFAAARSRLRPDGRIVASFAVLETALAAANELGDAANLVQVAVNRGVPIGSEGRLRLEADNPVFIVWGDR